MGNFTNGLKILLQFLSKLTWGKAGQSLLVSLVIIFSWFILEFGDEMAAAIKYYLNKDEIKFEEKITTTVPLLNILSKKTIEELNLMIGSSDLISGVEISVFDFQSNTSFIVYLNSKDKDLNSQFLKYQLQGTQQPFFTENITQNQRYVDIMNGDFACISYKDSILGSEMPSTIKNVNMLCGVGIPPVYGKFIGVANVFLRRAPVDGELDQIRIIVKNISAMIYNKELR